LRESKRYVYLTGFVITILLWYVASMLLKTPIIPSPIIVFINLFKIFNSAILIHLMYSLWRIAAGVLISILIGIPLGLCMGYFKTADRILSPIIYFTYPVPKIALLPVVMLLLGLGDASKILMLVIIIIFQIIVSSRDAVKDIPRELYYSMISLGASRLKIFKEIVLPASAAGILTSIRISLGTAVSILFFTETFGTEYGMGYFIMDSWTRINYVDMYTGIVILSLMGFFLFVLIDILEKLICPWKIDTGR
jgi:NitT/TauT family transport system permease protein